MFQILIDCKPDKLQQCVNQEKDIRLILRMFYHIEYYVEIKHINIKKLIV